MPRRVTVTLSVLTLAAAWAATTPAQDAPGQSATIELLLPAGAKADADGKELGAEWVVTISDLKPNETRRVKLTATYPGGAQDERLVDVVAGQRVAVPMPLPGPDRALTAAAPMLTPVQSAALSRDRRYIAAAMENVVVIWDAAAGRPVRTLAGHQKQVRAVAFSPDGKRLATGSADTTAVLWDPLTGAQVRTFRGHKGAVTSVAFSPDGARLLTGSADGTAVVWNAQAGEPIHTLRGTAQEIMAVAYGPDGATLATASADRTAVLWDAATGKQTFTLRGHREEVRRVAFSPDGRQAVTGSNDDTALLWDTATGRRLGTAARHTNDVYSVAFTPDGRRVITGERQELVLISDAATGRAVRTLSGHTAEIMSVVVSPDGRTFLTGSRDGTVRLWDPATGRELLTLTTDPARKGWAVAAPDGLFDATGVGRHMLGFRLTKEYAGDIDQFFDEYYRPGLLAEFFRGRLSMARKPLGGSKPPLLKIVPPRGQASRAQDVSFAVDVTDQGGGVSPLIIENNGARVAAKTRAEPGPRGRTTRVTFTLTLAPGPNQVRVRAAGADGSWEATSADVELTGPRSQQRARMYVVAVGVSRYAEKPLNLIHPAQDARALGELLRLRRGKVNDRVDLVPLIDRDATRSIIEDTVRDVAELTRPQDTFVVILCGHGALLGDKLYFAPHDLRVGNDRPEDALRARGLAVDDVATAMGTAPALRRVLVVDAGASGGAFGGALKGRTEFGLRGAVERLSRSQGIYALAAVAATGRSVECAELGHGALSYALLAGAKGVEGGPLRGQSVGATDSAGAVDVADWLNFAAGHAGPLTEQLANAPQDIHASAPGKGFPILTLEN